MTIEGNQFELNVAIHTLADKFDDMLLGPEGTFASFSCQEVDALCDVLNKAGRHDTANGILEAHAVEDDIDDKHYQGGTA